MPIPSAEMGMYTQVADGGDTPQKSNELIPKNCHFLKGPVTFSKAHHFGALQPLVLGGVCMFCSGGKK